MHNPWKTRRARRAPLFVALSALLIAGCSARKPELAERGPPSVAPETRTVAGEPLQLDASQIRPMVTAVMAVDLEAVARVAAARNLDILHARQSVEASRGRYESAVGTAFPVLVPSAIFEHRDGGYRNTDGRIFQVGSSTFEPFVAVQWVVNPGKVVYDIIAARKRLAASEHREQAVILETIRRAAVEYYDLVLAQATVSAAHQSVAEAEELVRITELRVRTGTGVPADRLRAKARLAERRQELVSALDAFYRTSIGLAVTLDLDASVTLVPRIEQLPPLRLVREDLSVEELLDIAVAFRPDLEQVRMLAEAVAADRGGAWWAGLGPELSLSYRYGGITGHANNVVPTEGIPGNLIVNPASPSGSFSGSPLANGAVREGILRGSQRLDGRDDQTYGFTDQRTTHAGVGWRLGLSSFGDLKTADARQAQAAIDARRRVGQARAQVLSARQAGRTHRQLIEFASEQVTAAEEALRLGEANLSAGTMTTLDVLQAQDAVTHARLRRAEAVVRYNQAQVNLLAALGLLDEAALLSF